MKRTPEETASSGAEEVSTVDAGEERLEHRRLQHPKVRMELLKVIWAFPEKVVTDCPVPQKVFWRRLLRLRQPLRPCILMKRMGLPRREVNVRPEAKVFRVNRVVLKGRRRV